MGSWLDGHPVGCRPAWQPLKGVVVLEFAWTLPGPYCGHVLATFGADVVKVEPPGRGDSLRSLMPAMFEVYNRGKRSVTIDLKNPRSAEVVRDLVASSDVLLEGFRPGVADRLGISAAAVHAINPAMVYCSVSGFGQTGPLAQVPGHDATYAALSGALGAPARSAPEPALSTLPVGDLAAGAVAAMSVLAALAGDPAQRRGIALDIGISDVLSSWTAAKAAEYLVSGRLPEVSEQQPPTQEVYRCRDGEFLALGAIEDPFWRSLCAVLGRTDWLGRADLMTNVGRARAGAELRAELAAAFAADDASSWEARLTAADVPAQRVLSVPEALDTEQAAARGIVRPRGAGREITFPAVVAGFDAPVLTDAPLLGADSVDVLVERGATRADIESWQAAGVLGDASGPVVQDDAQPAARAGGRHE